MSSLLKPENFIKNAQLITDYFGYWPTFHDDVVIDFIHNLKERSVVMLIESMAKQNLRVVVKFMFRNIEEFNLKCSENFNIIFDISFDQINNKVKCAINPSVGLTVDIVSKQVEVISLEKV